METKEPTTKIKSYVADFTMRLGPIQCNGKLLPVAPGDKISQFKLCTPDTFEPVKQFYIPESLTDSDLIPRSKMFTQGQLGRAKMVEDKLVPVPQSEIDAVKTSPLPNNIMTITPHPAKDVRNGMWHSSSSYVFTPKIVDEWYGTLVSVLRDERYGFIATCVINKSEELCRVSVWRDMIIVEKMIYPSDLNPIEVPDTPANDSLVEMASAMVEQISVPFNPDAYHSNVKANHQALMDALAAGKSFEVETKPVAIDLMEALKSFVAPKVKKTAKKAS
jgi:non-homologous end joining protein Ku